jgi:hypothetical protein
MKKVSHLLLAIALLASFVAPTFADTIRLKDGSVIRGQVIGFKDQQFTILIGANSKGRRGQTTVYVEDVESIEFDSDSSRPSDDSSAMNNGPSNSSQPSRQSNTPPDTSASRQNDPQPQPTTTSAPPTFFTIKVSVRADNANNGWTNSGLVVRKGQRLKITASGRVSLGRTRFSTPAGVASIPDSDKLMRNEATGALIAVIGDDNDDFILIGPRRDFVAQRDGVLFLGVNEGDLADNTGTYDIVIEAEAGSGTRP